MADDVYATLADTTTDDGKLACADGAAVRHPDTAVSEPRKRFLFQSVPEGKRWEVRSVNWAENRTGRSA